MMTKHNYDLTLLCLLLGLMPACKLGDQNLGETDESGNDTDDDFNDDHEEDPDGTGDHHDDNDDDTGDDGCGNGIDEPGELCFELISLPLPGGGVALDVKIDPIGDENSFQSIVALTTGPNVPLVIWPYHDELQGHFQEQPTIVGGPLPTATIPGIEIGDFDPGGIESSDIAYASAEGVVIGWDYAGSFDDVTFALLCPNPTSFVMGYFDADSDGRDVVCVHENDLGVTEVLFAANLGGRSFAAPVVVDTDLPAITPLRRYGGGFVAHDRVDQLMIWTPSDSGLLLSFESAPALAWDLDVVNLLPDARIVVASHEPQGLLLINDALEVGELLATAALPYRSAHLDVDRDQRGDLIATLASGHVGVWLGTDEGLADPILLEVGPDPRAIGHGAVIWETDPEASPPRPVIAVSTGATISLLFPNP
jgi:hypothetical protein